MKQVAVLVCAYNEEQYLPRALRAINRQTVSADEFDVIVVDNASTDKTAQVAREYGATVIYESQKGIPYAMKAGCDYASRLGYQIIAQTDADSEVAPQWLEAALLGLNQNNGSVVGVTGMILFYDIWEILNVVVRALYTVVISINKLMGGFVQFTGSNMAFKVNQFNLAGGVDVRYLISADVDLSKRMIKHGRIEFLPRMVVRVSPRRFRKQPVKALFMYVVSFFAVLRSRPTKMELDDIR